MNKRPLSRRSKVPLNDRNWVKVGVDGKRRQLLD